MHKKFVRDWHQIRSKSPKIEVKSTLEHSTDTQEQPISLIVVIFSKVSKKLPTKEPRRSPKSTENRPKGEKSDPRSAVLSIFVTNAVFLAFLIDF